MLLSQKNHPHSAVLPGDTCIAQPQIFSSFVLLAFPLSLDGDVTFLVPNYNEAKHIDTVSTYSLIDIITVPFLKISDIFVILLHKFDI